MAIIHVVMFAFEPLAPPEDIQGDSLLIWSNYQVCDRMLALKDNCIHPESKKPYVKMAVGGKENSPEGLQNGLTHVFVSEFENEQDREYYLKEDPAHLAFGKGLAGVVSRAQVVDFIPGVF
ncbi:putative protein Pop3 [Cytospora mali]|uniref:Stress-response A/B barrel domain-containing protein n=1 Tax=Cytospora mali TaxID=578113 RepID=A0A194W667_CYTMA|nr:putative protein Pop3 [Valsa mali]